MRSGLPHAAQAQVFKCPRPDGTVSYQGAPCPNNKLPPPAPPALAIPHAAYDPYAPENASQRPTLVPPPHAVAPIEPAAPRARTTVAAPGPAEVQRAPSVDILRKEVERMKAQNQAGRCEEARQQVGVNKEERPIYHYDKDGNKVYTADADRARSLAAAQRRAAAECN